MEEKAGTCFICGTVMPVLDKMWSTVTNDHFRNSRLEFLKGVRSLIDFQINQLSRSDAKPGAKVVVE